MATKKKSGTTVASTKAAPKKTPAKSAKAEPSPRKKTAKKNDNYTDPALREKLKEQITAGDKGGKPGQWSARKAQLLASEYEKHGGGYKKAARTGQQKHLEQWTEEKWQTADGKKAVRGKTTARYLPKKAWEKLSPSEREATDEKKKKASHTGKQFVENTPAAKRARKASTSK